MVKAEPSPALFSYQATLSSTIDADRASRSPSPSTSPTATELAPSALVEMVCGVQALPSPAVFSYQATVSSALEAARASRSPSSSTSPTATALASEAPSLMVCGVQALPSPAVFWYQATTPSIL